MNEKTAMKRIDLKSFNGAEGKSSYIAANGAIYDVSKSQFWKNGVHMNRHQAGEDLSESLKAAPHSSEVLLRFPCIGKLQEDERLIKPPISKWLHELLEAHPFFKRHPHPMTIHFPMAFFIASSIFLMWFYLIEPAEPLKHAILYMHILGGLSLPFAMVTGWLSWKINYLGKPMKKISAKIILSLLLTICVSIEIITIIKNPLLLYSPEGFQTIFPALIFSYLPIVSLIGYFGGQLVFPVHKK